MFNNNKEDIKDTRVHLCLDCGKCTVVCPVARYNPRFNPRLIVQRNVGDNGFEVCDESIWDCLNCNMCLERCNYRVEFSEFIRILRTVAFTKGAEMWCSHGGAMQSLMHLMARQDLHQRRTDWISPDIELSKEYETVVFVGCAPYFDILFSDINVNILDGVRGVLKLLNHAHVPFNLLDNERCCGRDLLLCGDREGFMAVAQANLAEFARRGVKVAITVCPECYYSLKIYYPKMLGDIGTEIIYWTEAIAPLLRTGEVQHGERKGKVTYHDPCTLGRGSRIFDSPRQILSAVGGLELVEMEYCRERSLCCGASSWVHCGATNRKIQEERLTQAEATGAEILVTSCPKCQIHLKCAQQSRSEKISNVDIQDLASLVAGSLK